MPARTFVDALLRAPQLPRRPRPARPATVTLPKPEKPFWQRLEEEQQLARIPYDIRREDEQAKAAAKAAAAAEEREAAAGFYNRIGLDDETSQLAARGGVSPPTIQAFLANKARAESEQAKLRSERVKDEEELLDKIRYFGSILPQDASPDRARIAAEAGISAPEFRAQLASEAEKVTNREKQARKDIAEETIGEQLMNEYSRTMDETAASFAAMADVESGVAKERLNQLRQQRREDAVWKRAQAAKNEEAERRRRGITSLGEFLGLSGDLAGAYGEAGFAPKKPDIELSPEDKLIRKAMERNVTSGKAEVPAVTSFSIEDLKEYRDSDPQTQWEMRQNMTPEERKYIDNVLRLPEPPDPRSWGERHPILSGAGKAARKAIGWTWGFGGE